MNTTTTELVIRVSAACMPRRCWGRYVNVALLEVEPGVRPTAIDTRRRGVLRIIERIDRCNVGSTPRAASARAIASLRKHARSLGRDVAAICGGAA